jgi:hypothetical protein
MTIEYDYRYLLAWWSLEIIYHRRTGRYCLPYQWDYP